MAVVGRIPGAVALASTIRIGNDERALRDADPQWITREIRERREDGRMVCVMVRLRTADLLLDLATRGCCSGGGSGSLRRASRREKRVRGLWDRLGLDAMDIDPGDVVAFVQQVDRYL